MPFAIASTDIHDGGTIPRRFTCDGADTSPDLTWSGAPDGTVSLALIVDDPDARNFAHWLVFNMTGSATGGLPEGIAATPDAPSQGINDFGKIGYGGPCPPSGSHHYRFTLYALDEVPPLNAAPHAADLRHAIEGHVIGQAQLTATYRRT